MPRKKKSPASVQVEAIVWSDASFERGEKLDTSPLYVHTVGFVVHEDATQVILAHETKAVEDWLTEDMDYTKIPLSLVVSRMKLGEIKIAREDPDGTEPTVN